MLNIFLFALLVATAHAATPSPPPPPQPAQKAADWQGSSNPHDFAFECRMHIPNPRHDCPHRKP